MSNELERLRKIAAENIRYERQLARLADAGKQTSCISAAVEKSLDNIVAGKARSFIIYGEPQSGKTEMMICLTAKLVDKGFNVIVHLLNDSVQLLQQNLERFQRSGLAPSARNFSEVMDPSISLKVGQHVIFCKKNAKDLSNLNDKLSNISSKVVIDDEADYATPNSKINKGEVTKINKLIGKLISDRGFYIGVTATPARLDLNNTFDNNNEEWVNFPPHNAYTGQDVFFPLDQAPSKFQLTLLPDNHDGPKFLQEAVLRFLVSVAHINVSAGRDENFSMLVHTSGKKIDHKADKKPIEDVFNALADVNSSKFGTVVGQLRKIAEKKHEPAHVERILDYIVTNRNTYHIVTMNSERDRNVDLKSATSPASLFTFAIGGNIVSRGVTFDNLLSMFFTRDSKHKIQQDTYIQRARMFGSRKKYLENFELTIPNQLYVDWHRCFVFHKLALAAIRSGLGSPVWLGDSRISPVSSSSVDQTNVSLDRGEMAFSLFSFDENSWQKVNAINDPTTKLKSLQKLIGDKALPDYVLEYVKHTSGNTKGNIAIHEPSNMAGYKDADKVKIERRRGFFGKSQRDKFPDAIHHFIIFHNGAGKARLIYKFVGNISFIKNLKHV
ncbi:DNA helicase [Bradyrhizobiaceae bacterium SG-6C]|nr:DNA helicase [Bradyrhizobiaceae bacterium SG-6C]